MTFEELEQELKNFDWTYEYSDDHRVWFAGTNEKKRIQQIVDTLIKVDLTKVVRMLQKYTKKDCGHFKVNDFLIKHYEMKYEVVQ